MNGQREEVAEREISYWKEELAGAPTRLELPSDKPRPAVQSSGSATETFELSKELVDQLRALGNQKHATLFTTLGAGFMALLRRYTGQDDILVGTPVEIERLAGNALNSVVLRSRFTDDMTFRTLLEQTQGRVESACAHADFPFDELVAELAPERDSSHNPLFQVTFALDSADGTSPASNMSTETIRNGALKGDLALFLTETTNGVAGSMRYSTDLFETHTVRRLCEHYRTLLEASVRDPDGSISKLPMLTGEARAQILYAWNDTKTEYPSQCVHELFERQVNLHPDAIALVFGEQQLTYRELNERANQAAHYLRDHGVRTEVLVGVCLERSPQMLIALLGIWKAGGAYVPLDPAYPEERLSFMVADAALKIVVTDGKRKSLFDAAAQIIGIDSDAPAIAQESTGNLPSEATASNLAYVMYTSGSTGEPKGVMVLHGGLSNYLCWAIKKYAVNAGDSVPVHTSISFDLTVTGLYTPLLAGGRVEILPEDLGGQNLVTALREGSNRSLVKITPAHLALLSQQLSPEEVAGRTKVFVIGGENLLAESLLLWRQSAPATRLINEYGPTETVVGCCVYEVAADDPRSGSVPIGRPIANTQLYILDRHMNPVPPGVVGELYIGGAGVARGYLNRPELTRDRFVADPFSKQSGARLYKSGDLARYRTDGILEYLGRIDNQVKVRGYRIELGEIEATLANRPGIKACAVLVREDEPGSKQLVGYVSVTEDHPPTSEELRHFLKSKLPEYMVPSHIVVMDVLPLTPNGKIDRKALPAPFDENISAAEEFVAPRTGTEQALGAIWSELLKLDRIGIHNDFFDLGGHSLLAIKAISRIRDVFGVDLPTQTLFEKPTIADLADIITEARGTAGNIRRISRRGQSGPSFPSFAQSRLWFLDQLIPDSPVYNVVDMIRFEGPYDREAMRKVMEELVRRHESLRTGFSQDSGQPMQVVWPKVELPLPEVDLSSLSAPERQREWTRVVGEEGRKSFDLSKAPLLRATMIHWSREEHRLLLTMHHIIADEWSMEILHDETNRLYRAFSQGRPSPLAELPIQYADFASWQRDWLQGEELQKQVSYWKKELTGAITKLDLPSDKRRPADQSFRGATETFELPKELVEQLKSLGRQEQATLFMTLEAAFMALLHRYSGQNDILVGTPISMRTQSETENLIGLFMNMVVLRAQFTENLNFRSLLQQIRKRALGAYAHPDLPFENLVASLASERDPSRAPVFQVMFVMHNPGGVSQVSQVLGHEELETGTSKFDLTLFVSDTGNGLEGMIEYSTDLFEPQTIRRLCTHYGTLLEAITRDPDRAISALPMLTGAERHQLLVEWNDTAVVYPQKDRCLHGLVEEQAQRTPDNLAIVSEQGQLTYRELNARANQLAHVLIKRGAGPDVPVGIYCTRTPDLVIGILAILKSGSAYVPLDPGYPKERLQFILEDVKAPIVVTQEVLAGDLPNFGGALICFDKDRPVIAQEPEKNPAVDVNRGNLAYVLFTSGSTGRPKGVALEHRTPITFVRWANEIFSSQELAGVLFSTSVCFDVSMFEMFVTLSSGGKLILASNALELSSLRARNDVTLINIVPSAMSELTRMGAIPASVKTVNFAGEPLPESLVEQVYANTGVKKVYNLYGPTETSYSTYAAVPRGCPVTIGRPIANAQCYILDAHRNPVPIGVAGELYITGDNMARGYYGRPDLTDERFVPNPFSRETGARMYRTGDLCRWLADGNIQCLGRIDHQVKIRGFRIELGEIEAILSRHEGVRQCVVVAREDAPGTKVLVAYVEAEAEAAARINDSRNDLRAYLKNKLPDYMVPSAFVVLDKLPSTPNGKVDRNALPAPGTDRPPQEHSYAAPRSETEEKLARLWSDVLQLDRVGIYDSFFELGGHSLTATQLMSRIRGTLGVDAPLQSLFKAPTVAGFAEYIEVIRWTSVKLPAPPVAGGNRLELEL